MIKYLELALSQEVYEYLEELDQMNWSARGNVLNQYLSNTSIGTTVKHSIIHKFFLQIMSSIICHMNRLVNLIFISIGYIKNTNETLLLQQWWWVWVVCLFVVGFFWGGGLFLLKLGYRRIFG
jgi:hypothetical protein